MASSRTSQLRAFIYPTEEQRSRGGEEQRRRGAEEERRRGAEEERSRGGEEQRRRGGEEQGKKDEQQAKSERPRPRSEPGTREQQQRRARLAVSGCAALIGKLSDAGLSWIMLTELLHKHLSVSFLVLAVIPAKSQSAVSLLTAAKWS